MEKFGMTTQASSGSSAATNAALADLKQKLEEQRSKTFEALEALKSAHDRAEVAEAESQTIKRYTRKSWWDCCAQWGKTSLKRREENWRSTVSNMERSNGSVTQIRCKKCGTKEQCKKEKKRGKFWGLRNWGFSNRLYQGSRSCE